MGNLQCNCYDHRNQTELYSSIETYLIPPPRDIHAPARNFFIALDREFAKKYALKDLLSAYPDRRLSAEIIQMIWIHYFIYDESSTVEQSRLEHDTRGTTPRTHKSVRSSSHYPYKDPHDSPHYSSSQSHIPSFPPSFPTSHSHSQSTASTTNDIPTLPPLLSTSHSTSSNITDLDRMIYLITDVLRYDLLVLKDHYDGVKRQYKCDGLQVNPQDPAIVKIKSDVLKLNHMPIDYIAKLILKEMHEPEVEAQFAAHHTTSDISDTCDPNEISPRSPSHMNPMTERMSSPHPVPSPPLTLSLFQSRFDRCMRICLDKYYRRGFWLLFCLNVMDYHYHRISQQQQQQQYGVLQQPQQHESSHSTPTQPLYISPSHAPSDLPSRPHPSQRRRRMTYSQSHTFPQSYPTPPDILKSQPSRSRSVRPFIQSQSTLEHGSQSQPSTTSSQPLQRSYHHTSSTSTRPSRHSSMSRISVASITPSIHTTLSTTPFQTPTASLIRPEIPPLPLNHVSQEFQKSAYQEPLKTKPMDDTIPHSKHDHTTSKSTNDIPPSKLGFMDKSTIQSLQVQQPTTHSQEYVHSPA